MSLFKHQKNNSENLPDNEDQKLENVEQNTENSTEIEDQDKNEDPGTEEKSEEERKEYESKLFYDTVDYCASPTVNYLSNIKRGVLEKNDFFQKIEAYLKRQTQDESVIQNVKNRLDKYIWGYYIIDDFLYDDSISDIKIMDENHIRIKRNGKRENTDIKFKNYADYQRFVDIICSRNKVSLSDINAMLKFTDIDSNPRCRIRFNITSGLVNSNGKPVVHMRKILKNKKMWDELTGVMVPPELVSYLKDAFENSPGILFTGKGAAGKTTLMNLGLEEIPEDKDGLVVQENDELFSKHPGLMFQHIVESRNESKVQYTLKDESTNGLLIDLDYFIIGEIKGGEAAYFMNAAYTGHQCWASVHGANSQEAINKLVDYIKYETDYTRKDILRMLRFMKTIIFMKDYHIEEISEITGLDKNGELEYKLVYKRGVKEYVE